MSARLNIITPDHILAYVEDALSSDERAEVEAAVREDDRAARALKAARAAVDAAFTEDSGDD